MVNIFNFYYDFITVLLVIRIKVFFGRLCRSCNYKV